MLDIPQNFTVVIPAAGVGKRMKANCPKQYLSIHQHTILEHTVFRLLSHPYINDVIIALGEVDEYFPSTTLFQHPKVTTVVGGKERVDSVLAGLKILSDTAQSWAIVHDAARPCVTHDDISQLIESCINTNVGGLLASKVRDTMKQANDCVDMTITPIKTTVERSHLWHAFTPQMYRTSDLIQAIENGLTANKNITDESSAIELFGLASQLVEGRSDNIKITTQDDLAMAQFILEQQHS